eukprot:1154015-Pelagomonas_calceolata.AAC.10
MSATAKTGDDARDNMCLRSLPCRRCLAQPQVMTYRTTGALGTLPCHRYLALPQVPCLTASALPNLRALYGGGAATRLQGRPFHSPKRSCKEKKTAHKVKVRAQRKRYLRSKLARASPRG